MSKVEIHLKAYEPFVPGAGKDPVYRLRLRYEALSYFALINSFRFSMPIYSLLFILVSTALVLAVVAFWLINLQFAAFKRPPALRFSHLARVTFVPPMQGALVAAVPALIVAGAFLTIQNGQLFSDIPGSWIDFGMGGEDVSDTKAIQNSRGRLGLMFIVAGLIFLDLGADKIVPKPTLEEAEEKMEEI